MATCALLATRLSRRGAVASLAAGAGALALGVRPTAHPAAAQGMANPDGTEPLAAGSDLMPRVPVVWRLVTYVAKPAGQAPALARTLNFLMPLNDGSSGRNSMWIANATSGDDAFLVTHVLTAAFGAQNDVQTRFTEATKPVPYVAWELIIAEAAEDPATVGDATLLDLTEPFTAPQVEQEMELVFLGIPDAGPAKVVPEMDMAYPLHGYVYSASIHVTRPDGTERLWKEGSTHLVRQGDELAYAGEEGGNGFLVFPRFVAQRSY